MKSIIFKIFILSIIILSIYGIYSNNSIDYNGNEAILAVSSCRLDSLFFGNITFRQFLDYDVNVYEEDHFTRMEDKGWYFKEFDDDKYTVYYRGVVRTKYGTTIRGGYDPIPTFKEISSEYGPYTFKFHVNLQTKEIIHINEETESKKMTNSLFYLDDIDCGSYRYALDKPRELTY